MKLGNKTVLGIDISEASIKLVLLRGGADGAELVKTASSPVPEGAIKDGNVADPALLANALRELKVRNKIGWTNHAAVSLVANPVVLQITELPKPLPTNIAQFVQDESKRCVAFSGKNVSSDYCRAGSAADGQGRVLTVATDERSVADLAEACSRAGLNVEAIEPAAIACAKAFYAKKIASESEQNLLLATLRDRVLTLCVFRAQALDFVRTKHLGEEELAASVVCERLSHEMADIIKFYDFEIADADQRWGIVVVSDGQLAQDAEPLLKKVLSTDRVQTRTDEDAWQDTPFAQENLAGEKPSAVAIGLAMRLLDMDSGSLRVNLAPPESAEVRGVKNHVMVAANIVALLLLIMVLAAGALSVMTRRVSQRITREKQTGQSQVIHGLLEEQELLEKQMRQLSNRPDSLDIASGARDAGDWANILDDIRRRTPETVRVTELYGKKDSTIYVGGVSLSYDAVRLFIAMLNKSSYVKSASPIQTARDREFDGMVKYSISCVLMPKDKGA
ncbi:MAG: pilus assembly protein PilM [Planctomycetota bacterium]|jgi:Tfp pilus assembly PilM family ATPase/Tfp pilus assembly protein PilN